MFVLVEFPDNSDAFDHCYSTFNFSISLYFLSVFTDQEVLPSGRKVEKPFAFRLVVFLCNEGEGKSGCKTFTLLSFKLNLHLISYPLQKL